MVRTQIYLTEEERKALSGIAKETGQSQSETIREAENPLIERYRKDNRLNLLREARGLWKHRTDLPDFKALPGE
jgi:hypothetical protein